MEFSTDLIILNFQLKLAKYFSIHSHRLKKYPPQIPYLYPHKSIPDRYINYGKGDKREKGEIGKIAGKN